ncbi:MAG: zinc-dependent peptidase, partial [Bacteroidia bacterium]
MEQQFRLNFKLHTIVFIAIISVAFIIARFAFYDKDLAASIGSKRSSYQLTKSQIEALRLHFPYYNNLSDVDKQLFEKRLAYFIAHKKFIEHDGVDVFGAMQALICAEAIKITFGLNKFILPHFKFIRIYPQAYYSEITKGYHK